MWFENVKGEWKAFLRVAGMAALAVFFGIGCGDKSSGDDETYIIAFNAGGGIVTPKSGTTGSDGTLASLPEPTRTGYTFNGWFTAETDGEKVTKSTVFSSDNTIYAKWSLKTYKVTFNANGGTVTPESDTTDADGTLDSLPEPTRTGYTFNGWYSTAKGGAAVTDDKVFKKDTTIYAQWTLITYTITFDAKGGTVTPTSGTTGEGWRLSSLPVPTKDGLAFEGWFTAEPGGERVTTSRAFSADYTICARWIPAYTVTFDPNGGTVSTASGTTGAGRRLTSLPTPKRNGYTFDGWFTGSGTAVTTSTSFSADATIYARWTVVPTPIKKTTFMDERDNKTYKKITIGTQVWMTENLNYAGDESNEIGVCYDHDPANCVKYGRLYDWNTAMEVCPVGWHLPNNNEWETLMDYVGYPEGNNKLKSSEYWEYYSDATVGTDDYGFSLLPAGYGSDGTFNNAGYYGYLWSAAWYSYMVCSGVNLNMNTAYNRTFLFSVRCVQDKDVQD